MKTPRLFALTALTTMLVTPLLHAANRTWSGGAISNDFWSDSDNWSGGVAPVAGDVLIFPAGIQQSDRGTRNNLGNTIFQSLRFDGDDFSVNGDTVRVSGGITVGTNVAVNFETGIQLTADQSFTFANKGGIFVNSPSDLDVNGATLTLDGTLTSQIAILSIHSDLLGTGAIIVKKARLRVDRPTSFTGPITVETSGDIRVDTTTPLNNLATLGSAAGSTTIRDLGNLTFSPFHDETVAETLRLDGGGEIVTQGHGGQSNPVTITLAGPIIFGGTGVRNLSCRESGTPTTTRITSRISGSGDLERSGSQMLFIEGALANTFSGSFHINEGLTVLAKPAGVAALACAEVFVRSGGDLRLDASEQIADTARLHLLGVATFNLNGKTETVASLEMLGGTVSGGNVPSLLIVSGNVTTLGSANPAQLNVNARIAGAPTILNVADGAAPDDFVSTVSLNGAAGSSLRKTGAGRAVLNEFTGNRPVEIQQGSLVIGSAPGSAITLNGGTLTGAGTVGSITSAAGGGTIAPGSSVGTIFCTTVALNAATTFAVQIQSAAPGGASLLDANFGTVNLGSAQLVVTRFADFQANIGEEIVILDNDGADVIVGTFAGLAQGAEFVASGARFRVSYTGGTGNDITLTLLDQNTTGTTRTWTGLGGGTGMDLAQNWNPTAKPVQGERLNFPGNVAAGLRTITDTIPGFDFYDRLDFTGAGWSLSGGAIALKNGITTFATGANDQVSIGESILLTSPQTFANNGVGKLFINQPASALVNLNGQTLTLATPQPSGLIVFGEDPGGLQAFDTLFGSGGAGGALVKTGAGTLTLKSFNSYSGLTTVTGGTLEVLDNDGLGAVGAGNGTTIASGTTLIMGRPTGFLEFFAEDLSLDGTLRSRSLASEVVFNRTSGALTVAFADRPIVVESGLLGLDGLIQGAGGLAKSGAGTLLIGGFASTNIANTFTGRLLVSEGTLALQKPPGINAVGGEVVVQGAGARLELRASDQLPSRVTVTGGTFSLSTFIETLPQLVLSSGTVTGSGTLTIETDLTVGGNASTGSTIAPPLVIGNTAFNLTVEQTPATTDLLLGGGVSSGVGAATLVRLGGGVAVFNGGSTVTNIDLRSGITVFPANSAASAIALNGGTVRGTGTVGSITSGLFGGTVDFGAVATGIFQSGAVAWNASTHFALKLGTPTAGSGHDQLGVTGTVNLNGTQLDVSLLSNFSATAADTFVILQNDGADAVIGAFTGLPENATLSVGGKTFRISYIGGTGNDVTLRLFQLGTGITRQWTGNGADNNWTTAANWIGSVAPSAGDDLVFPLLGAVRRVNVNNFPANTTFNSIQFQGSGYSLSGAAVGLNNGVSFNFSVGASSCLLPIACAQAQTFSATGGAQGTVDPSTALNNGGFPLTIEVSSANARLIVRDISGSGALRKVGVGPATLTANTHTGANEFSEGEVLLDTAATGLGNGVAGTTVAAAATLRLNAVAATTITTPLTLGGALVFANSPVTFSGAVALSGSDAAVVEVTGAGLPIFSGAISGPAGFRKTGAGDLTFSGASANTFSGGLFVEAGVLRAQKTGSAAPGPVSIGDGTATAAELRFLSANQLPTIPITLRGAGAHFNLNGFAETIGNLVMTSGTVSTGAATLTFSGTVNTFAAATPATLNGNLTSANGGTRFWTIEDGAAADDLVVNGVVSGPGSLVVVKSGEGQTVFAGNSNFPKLRLEFGTASFTGTSPGVAVELGGFGGNQATLTGNGFTGSITTPTVIGGKIAPGGILTASGNTSWNPETRVQFRLLNPTPGAGHDQFSVLGTPTLGGAALELSAQSGFAAHFGDTFKILDNNFAADPVVGTFAGLPEGAIIDLAGLALLRLSYTGGDGNDVTLTVTQATGSGLTHIWDGGSATDGNWTTAANWVGDIAPAPGAALEFPAGAARTSNTNNFPAFTTFDSLRFTGSGYAVSGANLLVLNRGIRAEANIGGVSFGVPLLLAAPQTFFADAGAALTLLPAATINTNGQLLTFTDTLAIGLGALDLQGIISGSGGVVKTGSGTIFVRGNNTFTGAADLQQGGVQIFHMNALGATTGATSIQPGAFLQLSSAGLIVPEPIALAGTIFSSTGANQLTGAITLPGPGAGTVSCTSPLELAGVISGPGSLAKTGVADLTFTGAGANTFTGGFVLNEANARLQKTAGITALPGPVTIGDGLGADELRLLAANQIADAAIITVVKGGTLHLNNLAETIGGLVLTEATVQTGTATLTLDGDLQSLAAPASSVLNGQIQLKGPNGSVRDWNVADGSATDDLLVNAIVSTLNPTLEKSGPGRARFSAVNTMGAINAREGSAIFTGDSSATSIVLEGGTVGGTGTLADIVVGSGGAVSPGLSPGIFNVAGRITWNPGTTFNVELNGLTAGTAYDRLTASGAIDLGGSTLALSIGFTPAVGDSFNILRNAGSTAIAGTFAGLPEGAFLSVAGSHIFQITYAGNDGDDVVLTRVEGVAPTLTSLTIDAGTGPNAGLDVVTITATGTPRLTYQVETTENLLPNIWITESTATANATTGALNFIFTQPEGIPQKFYRLRLP